MAAVANAQPTATRTAAPGHSSIFAIDEEPLRTAPTPQRTKSTPPTPAAKSTPIVEPGHGPTDRSVRRFFVKPSSELQHDASWQAFRRRLADIVRRKDRKALWSVYSPNYFVYDPDAGVLDAGPRFRRGRPSLRAFLGAKYFFWQDLRAIAEYGVTRVPGKFYQVRGDLFCGPSFAFPSSELEKMIDPETGEQEIDFNAFVIGVEPLHKMPDPSSPVLLTLKSDVVLTDLSLSAASAIAPWARVELPDGSAGYVRGSTVKAVRSDAASGPDLCFKKETDGEWRLRCFLEEGD